MTTPAPDSGRIQRRKEIPTDEDKDKQQDEEGREHKYGTQEHREVENKYKWRS